MSQSSSSSRYMTLSHCWGQLHIKRLETATLDQMCDGINLDELPRTFQDAIKFTRALDVRFLWIDSLCIIQDSVTDWAAEAGTMKDVYKHAFCNIAAPDGRSGCFVEKDPQLSKVRRVQPENDSTLYDLVADELWLHNVDKAPLNTRAWVVQERYLSPRILHCSRQQLFWECCEPVRSFCTSGSSPSNLQELSRV